MKITILNRERIADRMIVYPLLGLLSIAFIFFLQNYFRFSDADGYSSWRSLAFNTLTIVPFVFFVPYILRFHTRWLGKKYFWFYHLLLSCILLFIYAIGISIVLYVFGFLSKLFLEQFFLKYFTRTAHIHLILYWIVVLFQKRQRTKVERQSFLEVLNGNAKVLCKKQTICWIESFDHYVKLYTREERFLKKESMDKMLNHLGNGFIRIHRKYIIQLAYLEKVEKIKRDRFAILSDGTRLKVSNTYLEPLEQALLQIREQ